MTIPEMPPEPQATPQQQPDPPATPALELVKRQLRKPRTFLPLGGALLFVAFIAGVCLFGGGGTAPAAAQAPGSLNRPARPRRSRSAHPTPTPEPTPTATPVAFPSLIPDQTEEYRTYRYYHFLYEYDLCFGAERPGEEVERETLESLPVAVGLLLDAYAVGGCEEPIFFAIYEGRLPWLLHWRQ